MINLAGKRRPTTGNDQSTIQKVAHHLKSSTYSVSKPTTENHQLTSMQKGDPPLKMIDLEGKRKPTTGNDQFSVVGTLTHPYELT
jgi:hypothetical protein